MTPTTRFRESPSFGATAFANDAITALTAEGVDLTGFGLGWGDVNVPWPGVATRGFPNGEARDKTRPKPQPAKAST